MSKNEIINQIKKRSGDIVDFDLLKISNAISKAFGSVGKKVTQTELDMIGQKVVDKLGEQGFSSEEHPTVEDVQNFVESSLIDSGYPDVVKQYILYREKHDKLREDKLKLLNTKTLDIIAKKFDIQCLQVLASRYLFRNNKNEINEQPVQLFDRVALLVGISDMLYSSDVFDVNGSHEQDIDEANEYKRKLGNFDNKFHIGRFYLNKWHFRALIDHYVTLAEQGKMKVSFKEILTKLATGKFDEYAEKINEYFNLMASQDFLPNTPTLMNAGGRLGQLSACFVLDMQDDLGKIMKTASDSALIFQSGGGVGINYSDLREEGDIVASTSGVASGPVSFMEIINTVTDVIKQGGKRRGANMGIIEAWHPDVEKFISRKQVPGILENFNVSVGVWEDFWKAVISEDGKYMLKSPRDHKPVKEINAHKLIDSIANSAHASAEPGLIFFDNINKYNVFAKARGGPLRATNPCVTGDTLLATENGWVKIKDVVNTKTKIFYEEGKDASLPKGIMMTRPNENVYIVELQNGMKIKCTKDHPLLTDHGMIALKDVRIGDNIKLASFPSFGTNGTFDEGLLTGWIVSDGYFTGDKAVLDFYGEKKQLVNTFTDIINKIIPDGSGKRQQYIVSPIVIQDRDLMSLSSTRLKVILMNKFCMTVENKTMMNEMLLQTTEEFQKGFLKSMFSADGTVNISNKSRASIKVGSVSPDLLRMMQLMLSNFGIKSTIYLRKKSGVRLLPDSNRIMKEYNCKDYYELYVTAKSINIFTDKIGFIIKSKTLKIKNYIDTLTRGFYNDQKYTKIKSITLHGQEPVYDVIESPNHEIGLNGIITSNCGEQSLYPYESCNLGSINLANLVKRDADGSYEFDWQRYEEIIRKTTRFLDNIIDVNNYPIPEISKASKESRRIGLGVMGVADLLYKLKIPYNSEEGYEFQSNLSEALTYFSMDESITLARERGEFPLYSKTEYPEGKIPISGYYEKEIHYDWDALINKIIEHGIRNVLTTTVAPTGTLSMLADCSSGMEPQFALSFEKQVTVGKFFYTNKVLKDSLEKAEIYSEELLEKIANNYGSVRGISEVPKEIQDVFVTAMDIHWADHLMAQGVWQDWIGNAIAKTINMPHDGTSDDVKAAYLLAHDLGLKGITVYRDGSRNKQVLHMSNKDAKRMFNIVPSDALHEFIKSHKNEYVKKQILDAVTKVSMETPKDDTIDFSMHESEAPKEEDENECPTCSAILCFKEGCCVCIECGYSGCASG